MWDSPRAGLEPVSPALACGFLTTAPPGKSPHHFKYTTAFWSLWFSDEKVSVNLTEDCLYITRHFMLFSRFSLCRSTIWLLKCLGVSLYDLILGVHWTSWSCRFICFIKFGKFLTIVFQIFILPFPLFETTIMHTWGPLRMGSQRSLGLCSLFFILFSFCSSR